MEVAAAVSGTWVAVALGALVVSVLALAWQVRRGTAPRVDAGGLLLLQQQLDALRAQLAQSFAGQGQAVGERLDATARMLGEVQHRLGELGEATSRVYEVGRDVASLHDILAAPKLRGGLGELLLGELLAQVLPPAHFTLQHAFRSGERVDAVVVLGDGLVPIDSKFPLEDFRRLLEAPDDDERARARKAFSARVRKHVDDIADKYILPDEGTFDFALMYIPAENVYYETIVREEDRALAAYALERKVIPVSPNCFYAYLQAIVLGLKGLRIEAHAQEVIGQLARLSGDLARLRDDFRLVGKHLGNASAAFAAADRRIERFAGKLGAIGGEEEAAEPPTLPLLRSQ